MTRREAKRIIREENLERYCFFENRDEMPDEVGIMQEGKRWYTYMTDERCSIDERTKFFFDTEEEALDNFIHRLRLYKEVLESQRRRKRKLVQEMKEAKLHR